MIPKTILLWSVSLVALAFAGAADAKPVECNVGEIPPSEGECCGHFGLSKLDATVGDIHLTGDVPDQRLFYGCRA